MKTGVLAEPILVGRERELEELMNKLDLAIEGKGTTVFVTGEAGSGKTRLTHEFLKGAKEKGVSIMAGWCLSEAESPYFPFVEAFNSYFSSLADEEQPEAGPQVEVQFSLGVMPPVRIADRGITAWLTGTKPQEKNAKTEIVSPQVWKDQVFAGVARTLHEISVQLPIVLFIEDMHWADSASLALLHYVARVINNSERILVLATFRSEELTTDAEGHPHPLAETLKMMNREDLFTEIELTSLNQADVAKIAKNMIGESLQMKLTEKLTAESNGNPLFVVESLRMLHEQGSFVQKSGVWHLAVDELGIPSKIRDIILCRLACLKYSQRRVLDAASVIGEEFNVELLSTVLGQDSLEVLETLNVIAHSTSIVLDAGNRYRFDHVRSREILYEALSPSLKRGYHNRIAETLERTKSNQLPLSELAYHFAQAGNKEKAIKYSLQAGSNDIERFSNLQAINHFRYVLKTIDQDPEHFQERILALDGLAKAYAANNIFSEATKVYEQLCCVATGVLKLRTLRIAAMMASLQGNVDLASKLIAEAENYVELDRLEKGRLYGVKAGLYGVKGQVLRENREQALRIFEEEYSIPDLAMALSGQGFGYALQGQFEKGLAYGLLSLALFSELGDLRQQVRMHQIVGETLGICFLSEESIDILEKGIEIEEKFKLGDFADLTRMYISLGFAFLDRGFRDWEQELLSKFLKAVEYAEKTDSAFLQGYAYSRTAMTYLNHGDVKSAEKYYEKLNRLPSQALQSGWVGLARVKTHYYLAKGEKELAMKCFNEHLGLVKSWRGPSGQSGPVVEAELKVDYSKILLAEGKNEEAASALREAAKIRADTQKRFEHVNLYMNFMARSQVTVGQAFDVRVDLVNVSRSRASLTNIQNILPREFQVATSQPEILSDGSSIQLKENKLKPLTVKTIKLTLQATSAGTFDLSPKAVYIDDLGQTKTCLARPITITVKPAESGFEVLPDRVSTGSAELDRLLLGGIPENYAVALTSPSTDERELIVKRFLEAGMAVNETIFFITAEAESTEAIAEKYPLNFYLFVCNLHADVMVQDGSNVFKLKGIENLTEIDIALIKAFRKLNPTERGGKRICIEIVSDILLQHRAVNTRRWLSALLPTLKSKGFTILAVVNPRMHPVEDFEAILGVFDGEIRVSEKETPEGIKQTLRVRKLVNQKYSDKEIVLSKEALSN